MKSAIRIVPTTGCRLPATRRTGFTLVEVLVIIAIILLLAGILIPALDMIRQNVKVQLTQSNINLISTACELYKNDHDVYPPSEDSGNDYFTGSNITGAEILALLLTGYASDKDTAGLPKEDAGDTLSDDDGRDGFGFRTVRRGIIYGPYNGTEKIPTTYIEKHSNDVQDNDEHPVFADAFGNPILYYRADNDYKLYENDNKVGSYPSQTILNQYKSPGRRFLIISKGKNGTWDESGSSNDDLVNQ